MERYRAQAVQCESEFLFGAISILVDADNKIRQSSNQRLTVELALMKIANLGQKKNIEPIGETYPLPELPKSVPTPQPVQPQPQPSVQQPAQQPTQQPTQQPVQPQPQPQPQIQVQPVQPQSVQPQPQVSDSKKPLASGASLSSLLGAASTPTVKPAVKAADSIDPQSAAKLENARQKITDYINDQRPRFIFAFQTMTFEGNTIRLKVPSEVMKEDIEQSAIELLTNIAAIAGVTGTLVFEIGIAVDNRPMKPIKLEDRIRHIEQKNPLVSELKKALDLEVN